MSNTENQLCITRPAAGDLSAYQFRFVAADSNERVAVVAVAGGDAIGVLQNDPAAVGRAATVAFVGGTKVTAGGNVTAGARVQSDNAGRAIAAANGDYVLGTALTGGAVGEVIEVLLGSHHLNV